MDTLEDTIVDSDVKIDTTSGDHDLFAHYARKADIEKSMFEGVEIVALCGKKWRPSRDFTKYPVCPDCKAKYEAMDWREE